MLNELNKEISKSATKTELKTEQNKILKLKAFDSSYFRGKPILKKIVLRII